MKQQTKEFREQIAKEFIKSLEEEQLDWKKNWKALSATPRNAVTNATYRGLNRFSLMFLCNANGWEDPRFATFKQITDKGWHLKRGSHGCKVEYWMPYNTEEKRVIPWKDANLKDKDVKLIAKYYHVFNAKDIEGIPPLELPEKKDINPDKILKTICKNMDIEILNDGGNDAFYRPSEDKIHLPEAGYFDSDYAYNSVAMHELGHATGAEHRLNRNIQNLFGSPDYAFEELVAEITSVFMSQDLASFCNGFEMDNHKAYVQSWISAIKDKPDILIQAIKEANRAADYLEVAAELVPEQKLSKEEAFEIGADKIHDESAEKPQQYNRLTPDEIKEDVKVFLEEKMEEYNRHNPDAQVELVDVEIYGSRSVGVHRENSDLDILVEYKGDLKEYALFNVLHQEEYEIGGMKVDLNPIREEESGNIKDYLQRVDALQNGDTEAAESYEVIRELKKHGFQPTRNLVDNIQKLNAVTGRNNSLKDVCEMNKSLDIKPEAKELLGKISSECRLQELAMVLEQ